MSDVAIRHHDRIVIKRGVTKSESKSFALCIFRQLAQDQAAIAVFREGGVESYRALRQDQDVQSDAEADPLRQHPLATDFVMMLNSLRSKTWAGVLEELETDEPHEETAVIEDVPDADSIAAELLELHPFDDRQKVRKAILAAEDEDFTPDQSAALGPRLIELAKLFRDSSAPEDEAVVWSAIRTGASMIGSDRVEVLLPLLEAGHRIETSLVTVKMVGRIFEAQPPSARDEYVTLATHLEQIARLLINPYALVSEASAALAQLALYALVASGSTRAVPLAKLTRESEAEWFAQAAAQKVIGLRYLWESIPSDVHADLLQLVRDVLNELDYGA